MWPFKVKVKIGRMHLDPTNTFEGCEHVITTWQYGSHPARVYAGCFRCRKFTVLDWRDPKARWFNRIFYSIPVIWQAMIIFITIGAVIYLGIGILR